MFRLVNREEEFSLFLSHVPPVDVTQSLIFRQSFSQNLDGTLTSRLYSMLDDDTSRHQIVSASEDDFPYHVVLTEKSAALPGDPQTADTGQVFHVGGEAASDEARVAVAVTNHIPHLLAEIRVVAIVNDLSILTARIKITVEDVDEITR